MLFAMNRTTLLVIGVLVAAGVLVSLWTLDTPTGRSGGPKTQVEVIEQPAVVPDSVAEAPAAPATEAPAPRQVASTAPAEPEVEAPAEALPTGPFEVNLGTHAILLKTPPEAPKKMLDVELVLVTPEPVTRKEIANRRRQLIRMLFFLGTRRSADSAANDGGKQLFASHLLARYRNVVKTGPISEVRFPTWTVRAYEPAKPDNE